MMGVLEVQYQLNSLGQHNVGTAVGTQGVFDEGVGG